MLNVAVLFSYSLVSEDLRNFLYICGTDIGTKLDQHFAQIYGTAMFNSVAHRVKSLVSVIEFN